MTVAKKEVTFDPELMPAPEVISFEGYRKGRLLIDAETAWKAREKEIENW